MLRRIWFMMRKEFIQVWRDRRLRIFLILPPLFQIMVYGYATNFDIKHVPTAIFDEDHSPESQDLINRFGLDQYTISSVLYFAMELYRRGIVTKKDTDGLELVRGNEDAIIEMI